MNFSRLMMLLGFIRSHLPNSVIVACAGINIAGDLSILKNNSDLRLSASEPNILVSTPSPNSSPVKGRQQRSERMRSIDSGIMKVFSAHHLSFQP
jgi:hypothetical protein